MDFISYVRNFDILLFGETWINSHDPVNLSIPGFECAHVFAQKSRGAKCGRSSGGVSVYFKSNLKQYISVVDKSDCGIIWLKIDQSILEFDEDAYICYIYVREPKSQVLRHEEIDYYEILEHNIEKFKNLGKVFVTGDFNSRTGECSALDYLTFDTYLDVGLNDYINIEIPPRVSRDSILDNNGRRLLNQIK